MKRIAGVAAAAALGLLTVFSSQAGPLADLSRSYQAGYLVNKSLPDNTSPQDRDRLTRAAFAPAFKSIGAAITEKYNNLFKSQQQMLDRMNKERALEKSLGLSGLSGEARAKKIAELIKEGKLRPTVGKGGKGGGGPIAAGPAPGGRDSHTEVTGSDGAKSVDFNGNSTKAPPKRAKNGIIDF